MRTNTRILLFFLLINLKKQNSNPDFCLVPYKVQSLRSHIISIILLLSERSLADAYIFSFIFMPMTLRSTEISDLTNKNVTHSLERLNRCFDVVKVSIGKQVET